MKTSEIVFVGLFAECWPDRNEVHHKQQNDNGTTLILAFTHDDLYTLDGNDGIEEIDEEIGFRLFDAGFTAAVCDLGIANVQHIVVGRIIETRIVDASVVDGRFLAFHFFQHENDVEHANQIDRNAQQ